MRLDQKLSILYREIRFVVQGLLSTNHPLVVHLVCTRRCNLACTYCNEYDGFSAPVPTALLSNRINHLAELRTAAVVFSGGEPLLHPELERLVAHARNKGMLIGVISNCFLLTAERIESLNRAGLDYLQVSVDGAEPDTRSRKSLRLLEPKLRLLATRAQFRVHINSVLGGGMENPEGILTVARRARSLGFTSSVGIIHNGDGRLIPLTERERSVFRQVEATRRKGYTRFNSFQRSLARGEPHTWRCRAGARFLYVCEDGLVHYCSQQRGSPGIPLRMYGRADIKMEYRTAKPCAPYCTVSCVHHVSFLDSWRDPQAYSTSFQKSDQATSV